MSISTLAINLINQLLAFRSSLKIQEQDIKASPSIVPACTMMLRICTTAIWAYVLTESTHMRRYCNIFKTPKLAIFR